MPTGSTSNGSTLFSIGFKRKGEASAEELLAAAARREADMRKDAQLVAERDARRQRSAESDVDDVDGNTGYKQRKKPSRTPNAL
eukprot:scaffold285226_cov26-Tisochrysis_lutea.AAC.1